MNQLPHSLNDWSGYNWNEYHSICETYAGKTAMRSKAPLINHINEGLAIMHFRGADSSAQRAFCLHPLLQNDEDLEKNYATLNWSYTPRILVLAMEYRNIANQYLSLRKISSIDEIALSPLEDVNEMLIADKVQNYKDFLLYHKDTHIRSAELDQYFRNWLARLEVPIELFEEYKSDLMLLRLGLDDTPVQPKRTRLI